MESRTSLKSAFSGVALLAALPLLPGCRTPAEPAAESAAGLRRAYREAAAVIPQLTASPVIDGDLTEWKSSAYTDGLWDIHRLRQTPWFEPDRNRLTDHGETADPVADLSARYYMAWDARWLYLGAEVLDNEIDVEDPQAGTRRWYFADCVAWFIEAPCDDTSEFWGQGDNAFCFVLDPAKPPHAAWWRHGTVSQRELRGPLPESAVDYALRTEKTGDGGYRVTLEARVHMATTFGASDPNWSPPQTGDCYSVEIVHTDPDGGPYGGHFIVYGTGDDDSTWKKAILGGPAEPVQRLPE